MALEALISEEILSAGVKFVKYCVGAVAEDENAAKKLAEAATETGSETEVSSPEAPTVETAADSEATTGGPVDVSVDSEKSVDTVPEEVVAKDTATESCTGLTAPVEEVAVAGKCEGLIPMFKDLARTLALSGVELEDGHPMKALVDAVRAGDQKALDAAAGKLALETGGWQPNAVVDNPGAPDANKDSLLVKPGDKLVFGVDGSLAYVPADGSSPVGVYNCADKTLGSFSDKEMLDTKPCHGPRCPKINMEPVAEKITPPPVVAVETESLASPEQAAEQPVKCESLLTPQTAVALESSTTNTLRAELALENGEVVPLVLIDKDATTEQTDHALKDALREGHCEEKTVNGVGVRTVYAYDPSCPDTIVCYTWTDSDNDKLIDPGEYKEGIPTYRGIQITNLKKDVLDTYVLRGTIRQPQS